MSIPSRPALALAALFLTACAAADSSGLRIVHRTPEQFCSGTGRSIAVERYNMKKDGVPLGEALERNGGVPVIDAITRAIYDGKVRSESEAAEQGSAACRAYFR